MIGDYQLICLVYGLVEKTGKFILELMEWRQKKPTVRTWFNFEKEFTRHDENLSKPQTAQTAHYIAAQVEEMFDEYQNSLSAPQSSDQTNTSPEPPLTANALTAADVCSIFSELLQKHGLKQDNGLKGKKHTEQGHDSDGKPIIYC